MLILRVLGANALEHDVTLEAFDAVRGHGKPSELDAKAALAIARNGTPEAKPSTDAADPEGRRPGAKVAVAPDDTGRDPVVGELVASSAQEIVVKRSDPLVGEVMVHFPRAGVIVNAAG